MAIHGIFGRFKEPVYSLMRAAFGVLFMFHGAQKLFGVLGRDQAETLLMWVAGVVEFFGGFAVAIGLFTHIAAFLCAGEMLVAYLISHAPRAVLPIENRGELALLYLFGFLLIAARGGGKWSADRKSPP